MKNIFLFTTSVFLLFTSFHFNNSSENIEGLVAISTDKVNIFYIGVLNPISVAISGVPIEATKVSISKGIVSPSHIKGQYYVRVFEVGKVMVYLEGKDKQGNTVWSSSEFRVKRIPGPIAVLGRIAGHPFGSYDRTRTIGRGLLAILEDFDFDVRFEALSFEVQYVRQGEEIKTFYNEGSAFSPEILKVGDDIQIGDTYHFDKLRVIGPDSLIRELPSFTFTIKE
ncbi:MAG: GldM family protein [Chitinophagales bacterium]